MLADPRHPADARLDAFAELWLTTLLPLCGAAFLLIVKWGVALRRGVDDWVTRH